MRTKLGNDVTLSFPKRVERGVRSEEGEVISSRKKSGKNAENAALLQIHAVEI